MTKTTTSRPTMRLIKWRIFDTSSPPKSLGVCEAATEGDADKLANKRHLPLRTIVKAYAGATVTIR